VAAVVVDDGVGCALLEDSAAEAVAPGEAELGAAASGLPPGERPPAQAQPALSAVE